MNGQENWCCALGDGFSAVGHCTNDFLIFILVLIGDGLLLEENLIVNLF